MVDYILVLLEQLGKHFSVNYTVVMDNIFKQFNIMPKRLSFFIINNALNNNTGIQKLCTAYRFNKKTK